jgi:hypothetical protein
MVTFVYCVAVLDLPDVLPATAFTPGRLAHCTTG